MKLHTITSIESDDERALIESIQKRECDGYGVLVDRYKDRLFQNVYWMIKNEDTAQDITQEAFVKAYMSLNEFRGESRFYSWLYRIAINLCRDWQRREQYQPQYAEYFQPQHPQTPEQEVYQHELAGQIEAALQSLPEMYREAFCLKHIDHCSYEEMSDMLDVSIEALKVRVHRARQMLRELLIKEEIWHE